VSNDKAWKCAEKCFFWKIFPGICASNCSKPLLANLFVTIMDKEAFIVLYEMPKRREGNEVFENRQCDIDEIKWLFLNVFSV